MLNDFTEMWNLSNTANEQRGKEERKRHARKQTELPRTACPDEQGRGDRWWGGQRARAATGAG